MKNSYMYVYIYIYMNMRMNYRAIPFEHYIHNSIDASTFYTLYNVSLNVESLSFFDIT